MRTTRKKGTVITITRGILSQYGNKCTPTPTREKYERLSIVASNDPHPTHFIELTADWEQNVLFDKNCAMTWLEFTYTRLYYRHTNTSTVVDFSKTS